MGLWLETIEGPFESLRLIDDGSAQYSNPMSLASCKMPSAYMSSVVLSRLRSGNGPMMWRNGSLQLNAQ